MGGHGYGVIRASVDRMDTEFVCIPRPIERAATEDGGASALFASVHSAKLWAKGERPVSGANCRRRRRQAINLNAFRRLKWR